MRSRLPARFLLLALVLVLPAPFSPGCSTGSGAGQEANKSNLASETGNPENSENLGNRANTENPDNPEITRRVENLEEAAEPAPRVREVTLPAGTEVVVRTSSRISTKTNQPGQYFTAVLDRPIVDDDWVVARKGAVAEGIITECDPGGRVKGVAHLAVKLHSLTLTDGRVVDIETSSIGRRARTTKKKDAQKIGIGAGIGAAIGAIAGGGKGAGIGAAVGGGAGTGLALATHGEPASIPSESRLTFKLTEPLAVVEGE